MSKAKAGGALKQDPRNAKKHSARNRALIRQSLETTGPFRSIGAVRGTVKVGNGVFAEAERMGLKIRRVKADRGTLVVVDRDDMSDEEADRAAMLDNMSADSSAFEYDAERFKEMLEADPMLAEVARQEKAYSKLLQGEPEPEPDGAGALVDHAAELQAKWKVKAGDLWVAGDHRLLCGDCRDKAFVDRLMAGDQLDLLWTDPPYGVSYVGKTKAALTIKNDGGDALFALLHAAFLSARRVMRDRSAFYIAGPPGPQSYRFSSALMVSGLTWLQTLVWVKNAMVLGHSDYHYKHEIIYYGCNGKHAPFYGNRSKTSVLAPGAGPGALSQLDESLYQVQVGNEVYLIRGQDLSIERIWPDALEVDRPAASREHPTMKPPELVAIGLENSTQEGALVGDWFAGSGSTLVACEQLGRAGRALELEPKYCAVTLERLTRLGLKPKRQA